LESDSIYLCIDAGNTRVKWGVHDGRGWAATGAIETGDVATHLAAAWPKTPRAKRAIASNVAGAEVRGAIELACAGAGIAVTFIRSEPAQLGVTSGYRDPGQLGSDRWAAMIAAHHAARGHKLVVCAGTALTIDALAGDGKFLGGLIVAGPALMRRSLDRGTAGLRLTEGAFQEFPATTPDAITSGAIQACVGAITRLHDAMQRQGSKPERIVLSGGAAGEIAPYLPIAHAIHENLVLDGLVLIAAAR
jgi:type III pantothenate kinase